MEFASIAISVLGLGLSVWALYTAYTAKMAVDDTLIRRNTHDDFERLHDLIIALKAAKDAARPWVSSASTNLHSGREVAKDIDQLYVAIDSLRTQAPIGANQSLKSRIKKSANTLDEQFKKITDRDNKDDPWKSVLSELQLILPRLEQAKRDLRDGQIRSSVVR